MQRDCVTRFVSRNNKSDLQGHWQLQGWIKTLRGPRQNILRGPAPIARVIQTIVSAAAERPARRAALRSVHIALTELNWTELNNAANLI